MSPALCPVVLAGGNGVRLWPLSRASLPKPFLPLLPGGASPFEAAVQAAARYGPVRIIGREPHRFVAAEQVAGLGVRASLVLEPEARGGGAAIALAAASVPADTVLLVLPSEAPGELPPPGAPLDPGAGWQVGRDQGCVVWDRVRAGRVLELVAELAGASAVQALRQAAQTTPDLAFERVDPRAWSQVPHLDAELLRRAAHATDVPTTAGTSLAELADLHRLHDTDAQGNALEGDAVAIGSRGCLVHAASRLVTVVDVEDLAVVETPDAVLVAPLATGARVRDLVALLETQDRVEAAVPRRVLRPWGSFVPIGQGPRWKAKRITVQPGQALSLQRHQHRAEHWVVVRGRARIQRGEQVFELGVDASTYIPCGTLHRLENPFDEPLVVVEVQTGDRLDEDDIERMQDRYGR